MLHNSPIPIAIRKKSHWKLTSCKGTKKYHFDPDQSTKLSIILTIYAKIILKSKNVCFVMCAQFLPAQYSSIWKSTKFLHLNIKNNNSFFTKLKIKVEWYPIYLPSKTTDNLIFGSKHDWKIIDVISLIWGIFLSTNVSS